MAVTASLLDVSPQSGFRTYVRIQYTDGGSGYTWESGIHRLAGVGDQYLTVSEIQTFADSTIASQEASEIQAERELAWQMGAYEGVDIDLEEWPLNGLDTIRKYFFRRLFNEQRDENDDIDAKVITSVRGIDYLRKHSNAAIRGWIDAGWGVNDVGSALSKRDALQIQYTQLDHGQAEIPLDDF